MTSPIRFTDIVIGLGVHDVYNNGDMIDHADHAEFSDHLRFLGDFVHEGIRVIWRTSPHVYSRSHNKSDVNAAIDTFNDLVRENLPPGVHVVDVAAVVNRKRGKGLHGSHMRGSSNEHISGIGRMVSIQLLIDSLCRL